MLLGNNAPEINTPVCPVKTSLSSYNHNPGELAVKLKLDRLYYTDLKCFSRFNRSRINVEVDELSETTNKANPLKESHSGVINSGSDTFKGWDNLDFPVKTSLPSCNYHLGSYLSS